MSEREVRCFISIDVEDAQILAKISQFQRSLDALGADLKIVDSGNVHVTLKFLGNVSQDRLPELETALARVRFSPFTLELKGVGAFPGLSRVNVVWVGIIRGEKEVERIYKQVEDGMASVGFQREGRRFNAHITVARARSGRKMEELAGLLTQLRDTEFGSFQADKVRLKRSVLRSSGPEYSTLYETRGS